MIVCINFRSQSGCFEFRSERCFHKVPLFFPTHIKRSGITTVQRFVLGSYSININAFGVEGLYPFHKISGIVLIIGWIQLTVCPWIQRSKICEALYFHPFWTSPGSGNDFNRRIDAQNLFQNRKDIVFLFTLQSKMLNTFRITASIFAQWKVGAADRDTDIAKSEAFVVRECFRKEGVTIFRFHLQKIKTSGACDSSSEAVHCLILFSWIQCDWSRCQIIFRTEINGITGQIASQAASGRINSHISGRNRCNRFLRIVTVAACS